MLPIGATGTARKKELFSTLHPVRFRTGFFIALDSGSGQFYTLLFSPGPGPGGGLLRPGICCCTGLGCVQLTTPHPAPYRRCSIPRPSFSIVLATLARCIRHTRRYIWLMMGRIRAVFQSGCIFCHPVLLGPVLAIVEPTTHTHTVCLNMA